MFDDSDAALIIGDPAMRLAALQLGVRIYDLAEEWRSMTGLPFVFAVWAVRADVAGKEEAIARDFLMAKREGLAQMEKIATDYANQLKLPWQDLLAYLRDNVNYDLDAENIAGLQRYFDLAAECDLMFERRSVEFLHRQAFIEAARK
jgi:chorismate dehydratase